MQKPPKIRIELNTLDKITEALSYTALIGFWLMIIICFNDLPKNVPTHFDGLGEVDSYGPKSTIFITPIFCTLIFIFLTFINTKPETFNYNVKITEENAKEQYTNFTRTIRYLKLTIIIILIIIEHKTIETSNGNATGLGTWFLPLTLLLLFTPIILSVYKSKK